MGRAATRLVQFDSKGEAETVALRASWDPGGELEWAVVQSPVAENATASSCGWGRVDPTV